MPTQTDRIRALNDGLRQNITEVALLSPLASPLSVKPPLTASLRRSLCLMISAMPTIRTKNMTLVRSRQKTKRSFSRSTITIVRSLAIPPTPPIRQLLNGS